VEQRTQDKTSDERTHNAYNDIADQTLSVICPHNYAGHPTDQSPYNDPDNEVNHILLLVNERNLRVCHEIVAYTEHGFIIRPMLLSHIHCLESVALRHFGDISNSTHPITALISIYDMVTGALNQGGRSDA
jgi:hypothetical protein